MLNRKSLYEIYLNVHIWISEIASAAPAKLTQVEFEKTIKSRGFISAEFSRKDATINCPDAELSAAELIWHDIGAKAHKCVVFLFPDSDKYKKKDNFRKLVDSKKTIKELLFIYTDWKHNLVKTATEFAAGAKIIRLLPRKIFHINLREHALQPEFEIATAGEVKTFMNYHRVSPCNIPRIHSMDPVAIYLGLIPGQVVKFIRPSQIAGRAISYRICIIDDADKRILRPNDVVDENDDAEKTTDAATIPEPEDAAEIED